MDKSFLLLPAVAAALGLAACGDDDSDSRDSAQNEKPPAAEGGPATRPEREFKIVNCNKPPAGFSPPKEISGYPAAIDDISGTPNIECPEEVVAAEAVLQGLDEGRKSNIDEVYNVYRPDNREDGGVLADYYEVELNFVDGSSSTLRVYNDSGKPRAEE